MATTIQDRKQETKTVKAALIKAGVPVSRIKHGQGTSFGWLYINVSEFGWVGRATEIAQWATGRDGEYNGRIMVQCDRE